MFQVVNQQARAGVQSCKTAGVWPPLIMLIGTFTCILQVIHLHM